MDSSYRTKDGGTILISPAAREHLGAHPEIGRYIGEAIGMIELPVAGSPLAIEVDMGRPVGRSGCVEADVVSLDDPTTFAFRKARAGASRVVLDAPTVELSTVVLRAAPAPGIAKTYQLDTAYVGGLAPHEPWNATNEAELERAIDFWGRHALVYDPQVMGQPFRSTWRRVMAEAAKRP